MEEYSLNALNDDAFIIERFTGKEDKNNKEIYEGDIIKQKRKNNCFGGKDLEERIIIGEPEYYELSDCDSGGPEGSYPILENEIIGNIYENLELKKEVENEYKNNNEIIITRRDKED